MRQIEQGTVWNQKELSALSRLRKEKKTYKEISKVIKTKSPGALERKFKRFDWDAFAKNPDICLSRNTPKKWTHDEMVQLDAFLQAGQSYDFIAEKMGRPITSVETQAQHTDWKAWRQIKNLGEENNIDDVDNEDNSNIINKVITALLDVCRGDFNRISNVSEEEFLSKVSLEKSQIPISFLDLKKKAKESLVTQGFGNPENIELGQGTYIVVGDSHGKHTNKEMFALLTKVNETLKPDKIIHIGHILDDDNDISYDWGRFDNLIIVAKVEELGMIQKTRNSRNFKYDIVRDRVIIEDLAVTNQDLISDYVKTAIGSLDAQIFDEKVIVNCHRLEFSTRCSNDGQTYVSSPGCLCEYHTPRTIKQVNLNDGKIIRQVNYDGYSKYRRMRHNNRYWEQGMVVIQVDKEGRSTLVTCPIKSTPKGLATSYFDKIITANGVFKPDNKIFINGDMHCDKHDANVLDIQEQICKDYKPDVQVNVGDTLDYRSLNHHIMDRGGVIVDKKVLDEAAQTHYVLKRVAKWAPESHLIFGNHERFARDFVEKYPQFGQYLDFSFICNLKSLGYKLTPLKNVLKIGSASFVHGEIKMFGQPGSKVEKSSRTFGKDVFMGHIHRPEIRFGCYSVGLSGELDQEYNEPEASNWMHGFGLCNQFMGINWATSVAIIDNSCLLNRKTYKPVDPESWKLPAKYQVRLEYDFGK
jgi:hypothetical protein